MNQEITKMPVPWKVVVPGLITVLVLFAVLASAIFGAGRHLFKNGEETVVAPSSPGTAVLTNLNGWVQIQDEAGSWVQAEDGQMVSEGTRIRTGELSSTNLIFYDGSQTFLAANAELSVDRLDAQKNNDPRVIVMTQWLGESEHEVAPNHEKGSTYEVHSPAGVGQAKGTVFQVMVTPDLIAHYYVIEGVVAVTNLEITVFVNAGQVSIVEADLPPLEPVASISGQGRVTQNGETWVIGGQTLILKENTAIFGDPQVGDWVEFQGRVLTDGTRVADWIMLLQSNPENRFNLRGAVASIGDAAWVINGQTIAVNGDTRLDAGAQEAIEVGEIVSVEGIIQEDGSLLATKISLVDETKGLPFNFTGMLEIQDGESWTVSGRMVIVDENTQKPEGLSVGEVISVNGWIQENGTWLAGKIERIEEIENEFEFTGALESMDPWHAAGIAFEVREYTEIDSDLEVGDLVHVEGSIDENGIWIAAEIIGSPDEEPSSMVLIGAVISMDPWVVSGIPLPVDEETVIDGEISVGMLVRVEILLAEDGAWQILRIEPLDSDAWIPGCIDLIAKVISVDGSQIQLENWPLLTLAEDVVIEGELAPESTIRFRLCFTDDQIMVISYIIIVDGEEEEDEQAEEGDKVYVCHKPNGKKGGHTLHISRSALPAHLGHGDYEGQCR